MSLERNHTSALDNTEEETLYDSSYEIENWDELEIDTNL